jgi:hypothetical protein
VEEQERKRAEEETKRKAEVECRGCGKVGALICSDCEMVENALFESEDTEGLVAAVGSSTDVVVGGVKRKAEEEATQKKAEEEATQKKAEEESKKKEKKPETEEERSKRLKYKKDKKVRRKAEKAQAKGWEAEVEAFLEDK